MAGPVAILFIRQAMQQPNQIGVDRAERRERLGPLRADLEVVLAQHGHERRPARDRMVVYERLELRGVADLTQSVERLAQLERVLAGDSACHVFPPATEVAGASRRHTAP